MIARVLVIALAAAAIPAAALAGDRRPRDCGRVYPNTALLGARGPAAVYVNGPAPVDKSRHAVVGCWRPTGRRTRLGATQDLDDGKDPRFLRLISVRFTGERVSYVIDDVSVRGASPNVSRVQVVDLRRSRLIACSASTPDAIRTVLPAANGALAWLAFTDHEVRVEVLDGEQHQRVVERLGLRTRQVTDLRIRDNRLTYFARGRTHTKTLRPLTGAPGACAGNEVRGLGIRPR